jgi:signal transduction histidine kinase
MLDQMAEEVQATIQELRELAHGIYPPLLADSGLGEALRAAAEPQPAAVDVAADGIGRYPPRSRRPSTSAAWRHCRTPPSTPRAHREVRLWEESGGLLFSVSDDGPGFDAADRRGAATAS